MNVCIGTDHAYIQPYVEQATADKTRAEKEKASYDVCFFNLFSFVYDSNARITERQEERKW